VQWRRDLRRGYRQPCDPAHRHRRAHGEDARGARVGAGSLSGRRDRRARSPSHRHGISSSMAHSSSSPTPERTSSRRSISSAAASVCWPAADARRWSTALRTKRRSPSRAGSCSTTAVTCCTSSTAKARRCAR
jgi:hypothetical protein